MYAYIYIYICVCVCVCVNDIFFFADEAFLSNYTADNALYSVQRIQKNHNPNQFILKKNLACLQKWFQDIYMFLNPGKCYYMTLGSNTAKNGFVLEDGTFVPCVEEHVVLGITINSHLTFCSHLKQFCKKVASKLNASTRIAPYLSHNQIVFFLMKY